MDASVRGIAVIDLMLILEVLVHLGARGSGCTTRVAGNIARWIGWPRAERDKAEMLSVPVTGRTVLTPNSPGPA